MSSSFGLGNFSEAGVQGKGSNRRLEGLVDREYGKRPKELLEGSNV
jgi:hypothetical protein